MFFRFSKTVHLDNSILLKKESDLRLQGTGKKEGVFIMYIYTHNAPDAAAPVGHPGAEVVDA